MRKIILVSLLSLFCANIYFWIFTLLSVISLIIHNMKGELLDLYYIACVIEGFCILIAVILLAMLKRMDCKQSLYFVSGAGFSASIAVFVVRWFDYVTDSYGEVFWFDPVIRGSGYLLMFALFFILAANPKQGLNRVRESAGKMGSGCKS